MNKFQQIDTRIEALCAGMGGRVNTEQILFDFNFAPEPKNARIKNRTHNVHASNQNAELVNVILRRYTSTYADDWQREADC